MRNKSTEQKEEMQNWMYSLSLKEQFYFMYDEVDVL